MFKTDWISVSEADVSINNPEMKILDFEHIEVM